MKRILELNLLTAKRENCKVVSDKKKYGNFIVSANVVKSKCRVWKASYTHTGSSITGTI